MGFCRSFRLTLFAALLLVSVMVSGQEAGANSVTADPLPQQATTAMTVAKPLPPALANPQTAISPVVLNTSTEAQATFPAVGVCPVITDYLYDLCQQNPDDSSCQPNN